LIDDLKGARVNLFIFQHTYDECINILHSAASILRDNNINIEKARTIERAIEAIL
jgi:flagellin-specific chaperone FliS